MKNRFIIIAILHIFYSSESSLIASDKAFKANWVKNQELLRQAEQQKTQSSAPAAQSSASLLQPFSSTKDLLEMPDLTNILDEVQTIDQIQKIGEERIDNIIASIEIISRVQGFHDEEASLLVATNESLSFEYLITCCLNQALQENNAPDALPNEEYSTLINYALRESGINLEKMIKDSYLKGRRYTKQELLKK